MALLPIYEDDVLHDGSYIHALPFCLKNCKSEKCIAHYKKMMGNPMGFYTCPYGLSTFVYNDSDSPEKTYVFSGLRERKSYKKKQAGITQASSKVFNPVLDAEELVSLAQNECAYQQGETALSQKIGEVNELLHEARKLNGQIKTECDVIWESSSSGDDYEADELLDIIKKIHIYSFIVYNRFQYFDAVLNPTLSVGSSYSAVIFKKFDKMRRLLKGYGRKNVRISLNTQSTYSYRIFQSFETLLFIILENAIKYSPDNKPITVNFEEPNSECLVAVIESTGPHCRTDELGKLGTKGFRGENAQQLDSTGQGIGLHFAKSICKQHNIDIEFSSRYMYKDHGVTYGTFTVKLHFDRNKQPG